MMTTERLNQSTDRIKESRRTMLETEELGVSILQDLHQQRQSLLHAHTTICTCLNCSTYYIDLISGFLIFSGCKAAIILANRTSITALIVNCPCSVLVLFIAISAWILFYAEHFFIKIEC
jgi:hypothetical protein